MGKLIDETGNKYSRLLVIDKVKIKGHWKWHCQCDCGNEINVSGTMLRSGNTKSCGCLQKERATESNLKRGKILPNQKFGKLTTIEFIPDIRPDTNQTGRWLCKCDCGNEIYITGNKLKTTPNASCGCFQREQASLRQVVREEENRYGLLTVIEEAGRDKDGRVLWRCICDCGNEKITLGKSLRQGLVLSCGCLHSKGEAKIQQLLDILNIKYERQKVFNECRGKTGRQPLFFDFYLPEYNMCLEYQGEQHYRPVNFFGGEDAFNNLQLNDSEKEKFCRENNIILIKIKYNQYNNLNIDYLKEVVFSGHLYS